MANQISRETLIEWRSDADLFWWSAGIVRTESEYDAARRAIMKLCVIGANEAKMLGMTCAKLMRDMDVQLRGEYAYFAP